jgi:CheY-like chemotaxis protein
MPEIDGQDIAELAKAVNQQIPIIVISGFLTPDLKKQLEDMGVRHFVNKPFKPDQLLQTVVDGLSGSPHTV